MALPERSGGSPGPTVADIGEDAFVRAVLQRLSAAGTPGRGPSRVVVGPGDDAAVVELDGPLVLSTDTLVQDVDFRLDWSSGYQVGRKAAVQVLADVEAMGAVPVGIVLALVVPGRTPVAWCLDLASGLGAETVQAGASVLGGDVADGGALVVTGTASGVLVGDRPAVRRDGARAGDLLVLGPAGAPLGASAAGLAVLLAGSATPGDARTAAAVDRVLAVHRAPVVDHTAGARARDAGARAMIDVSDGLLRDAARVARASGVVLAVDTDRLRPSDDLLAVGRLLGVDAREWVLTSGEEHAMLVCLPLGTVLPDGFAVIGRVEAVPEGPGEGDARGVGVTVDGVSRLDAGGWVHYARG